MIRELLRSVRRRRDKPPVYSSETSKVRHLILPYCVGRGCDVGFGGDKVTPTDCDGIDLVQPYASTGTDQVDVPCDLQRGPIPVPDNTYDYVYSSHLIEDFVDTKRVLGEFIRILRPGGNLILVFPDQVKFEETCARTGQPLNPFHVHKDMSLAFMKARLKEMPAVEYSVVYESDCEIDYNVVMALRILKK